jgi:hypothetical protein
MCKTCHALCQSASNVLSFILTDLGAFHCLAAGHIAIGNDG